MYVTFTLLGTTKGQLISKGHFVFSILPKNERKISDPVGYLGPKFEFSCPIFGRIGGIKKTFRNQLTFKKKCLKINKCL